MNRRDTLRALLALLAAPLTALAQAPQHARVGWLSSAPPTPVFLSALLLSALRELGWVEGRNLTLERRFADGRQERLPDLAAELVGLGVQVMVVHSDTELEAARRASQQIPIVVAYALDPVRQGLAASLAHPTANVTGLLYADPEFSAKSMQILKELLPAMRRYGILYQAGISPIEQNVKIVEAAARAIGIDCYRFPVRNVEDVDAALVDAKKKRVDVLRVVDAGLVTSAEPRILKFATSNLLPTSYTSSGPVGRGALISYTPNALERMSRVAALVDKILKGAKPAELPFEYAMRYDLIINLKTARRLGIAVPQSLLLRADKVIE